MAVGYLAGKWRTSASRAAQAAARAVAPAAVPPKTHELTIRLFGTPLNFRFSGGALSLAVILALTVLLAIAVRRTMVARRQKGLAGQAGRDLRQSNQRMTAILDTALDAII